MYTITNVEIIVLHCLKNIALQSNSEKSLHIYVLRCPKAPRFSDRPLVHFVTMEIVQMSASFAPITPLHCLLLYLLHKIVSYREPLRCS